MSEVFYTLTIKTTPTTENILLLADGYTQVGNTISVPEGTVVTYSASKIGYKTESGEYIMGKKDIQITLKLQKVVVLTIKPVPTSATVKLLAENYLQESNTISVPVGTKVSYTVSETGYYEKSGIIEVDRERTIKMPLIKNYDTIDVLKDEPEKKRDLREIYPTEFSNRKLINQFTTYVSNNFFEKSKEKYINGYIGERADGDSKNDYYIDEPTAERQIEQIIPVVRTDDSNITFMNFINSLETEGAFTYNQNALLSENCWSWSPAIDADMFLNYNYYYWVGNDDDIIPTIKLLSTTDKVLDIDDKDNYTYEGNISYLVDGEEVVEESVSLKFINGLRIIFTNDSNQEYNNIPYMISGCGNSIKLLDDRNIISQSESLFETPDYFVMERGCIDGNQWSEHNRWVHKSVLEKVDANLITKLKQAKTPIFCFNKDVELFNYGTFDRGYVDIAITGSSKDINGKSTANFKKWIGSSISVEDVSTILCMGSTEAERQQQLFYVSIVEDTDMVILQPISNGQEIINGDNSYTTKGDCVKIKKGDYIGKCMYYDGSSWNLAQEKTTNQSPLFNLYDKDKVLLSNKAVYLNSTFNGCTLFNYKSSKTEDDETEVYNSNLDRQVVITDSDNFIFNNTIETDVFKYSPSLGEEMEEITGFKFYKINGTNNYLNDWFYSSVEGKQYIKTQYIISDENELKSDNSVDIKLALTPDTLSTQKSLYIRKNGKLLDNLSGEYTVEDNVINVINCELGDVFDIKFYKKDITTNLPNGYVFEEPLSITVNQINDNIEEIAYNNCLDQMFSIIESQKDFSGSSLGLNNYFTISKDLSVGTKIIQHSAPIIRSMIMNDNDYSSFRNAIEFASNEYNRFKIKFRNILNEYFEESYKVNDEIPQMLDDEDTYEEFSMHPEYIDAYIKDIIENRINIGKEDLKPFYNNGVLSQLLDNAYIPATPAYLGVTNLYNPVITEFKESIKSTKPKVLVGHDGSYANIYGDLRDLVLLRLETLIYESANTLFKEEGYEPIFSKNKIRPGFFRNDSYSLKEYNTVYSSFFEKWADVNKVSYNTNSSFDVNDWKTWNWSSVYTSSGETLPGSYRAIYMYYYDTYRPNDCPWEMLGFNEEPSWWEEKYGSAPYTSQNIQMWLDIQNGYIADGLRKGTHTEYVRDGLVEDYLPVDEDGNLLSPSVIGIAVSDPLMSNAKKDWLVGDLGEVEFAYQQTSEYRYNLEAIMYLLKPSNWVELNWNTTNIEVLFNDTNYKQIVNRDTGKRDSLIETIVHNEVVDETYVRNIGVQQWISDYLVNDNLDIATNIGNKIRNAEVSLCYRCSGYYQENTISLLSDTAENIPTDNFNLKLFKSKNGSVLTYSGMIIEKTKGGFIIDGFDKTYPYFYIRKPYLYGKKTNFTENGKTITYYKEWKSEVQRISYRTVFTQIQDLYDVIIGYGKYLEENEGWYFNNRTSTGEILDFEKSGETFVRWATNFGLSSDAENTILLLNPGALGLGLYHNGVVDNMGQRINGYWATLDIYGKPVKNENMTIFRQSYNTYFTPIDRNIALIRAKTYELEHLLLIDNETIYGDTLYNPLYSSVINRLKLSGVKVKNWYGNIYAPGYIVQDGGAIPNFEKNASDLNYVFDTDDVRCQGKLAEYAKGTIGYSETTAFKNLLLNKQTMFDFYKGLLQEKGTIKPIQKLNRSDYISTSGDKEVELYENWAFKMGSFGHISDNAVLEFLLDTEKMTKDPQIITFQSVNNYYWDEETHYSKGDYIIYKSKEYECISDSQTTGTFISSEWKYIRDVNNYIVYWDDENWLKKPDSRTFKSFAYSDKATYPVGGFANLEDADYIVADEAGLEEIKDDVTIGQIVWVVKTETGDWDIRRKTGIGKFVSLRYKTIKDAYEKPALDFVYKVSDNKIDYYTNKNSNEIVSTTSLYTDIDMENYAMEYKDLTYPYFTDNRDYKYVAGTNYKVKLYNTVFNSPVPENAVQKDSTLLTFISKSSDTECFDYPYNELLPNIKTVEQDSRYFYNFTINVVDYPYGSNPQIKIKRVSSTVNEEPEEKTYDQNVTKVTLVCYEGDTIYFTVSGDNCRTLSDYRIIKWKNPDTTKKETNKNVNVRLSYKEGAEIVSISNGQLVEDFDFSLRGKYTVDMVASGGGAGGGAWHKKKKKSGFFKSVSSIVVSVILAVAVLATAGTGAIAVGSAIGTGLTGGITTAVLMSGSNIRWNVGSGGGSGAYVKSVFDFKDITDEYFQNNIRTKKYKLGAGEVGTGGTYGQGSGYVGSSGGTTYMKQELDEQIEYQDIIKVQGGAGGRGYNNTTKARDYTWDEYGVATSTFRTCGTGGTYYINQSALNILNEYATYEKHNGNSTPVSYGSYGAVTPYDNTRTNYGAGGNPNTGNGYPGLVGTVKIVINEIYESIVDVEDATTGILQNKDVKFVPTTTYSVVYSKFIDEKNYMYASEKENELTSSSKIYLNRSRQIKSLHTTNVIINAFNEHYTYAIGDTVTYPVTGGKFYICQEEVKTPGAWSEVSSKFVEYIPTYYYKITENRVSEYDEIELNKTYAENSKITAYTVDYTVLSSVSFTTYPTETELQTLVTQNKLQVDEDVVPPAFQPKAIGIISAQIDKSYKLYYDEDCKEPVVSTQFNETTQEYTHYTLNDLQTADSSTEWGADIIPVDEFITYAQSLPVFLSEPVWQDINGSGTYRITSGKVDYYTNIPSTDITDTDKIYSDENCSTLVKQYENYNLVYGLISDVETDRLEQTYQIADGDTYLYSSLYIDKIENDTPVYSDTTLETEIGVYGDYIPTWTKTTYTPNRYTNSNILYANVETVEDDRKLYNTIYKKVNDTMVKYDDNLYYDENQGISIVKQYKVFVPSCYDTTITYNDEKYGKILHKETESSDDNTYIALYDSDKQFISGSVELYVKLNNVSSDVYVENFDNDTITSSSIIEGDTTNTSLNLFFNKQCKGYYLMASNMLEDTGKTQKIVIEFNSILKDVLKTSFTELLNNTELAGKEVGSKEYNELLESLSEGIVNTLDLNGKYLDKEELKETYTNYRNTGIVYNSHIASRTCKIFNTYRCYLDTDGYSIITQYVKLYKYGANYYVGKEITPTKVVSGVVVAENNTYELGICIGDYDTITVFTKKTESEITEDEIQNVIIYKNIGDKIYVSNDSFWNRNKYSETEYKNILEDTDNISSNTDAKSGVNDNSWIRMIYQNTEYMFNLDEIERKMVSLENIKTPYLVNDETNETISRIYLFDPIQGYFPNDVLDEINYVSADDPVMNYESNTSKWGDTRVGFLWWDVSKVRYVDYHQGSLEYRRSNWGKQLAGSEIVINEWTKSTTQPSDDIKYITKVVHNDTTNSDDTYYYYWNVNPTTIGNNTREISAFDIAQIINDPTSLGILWTSPVSANLDEFQEDNLILANYSTIISGYKAVLQYNIDSDKEVLDHTEWKVVKENANEDVPETLWEKMKDSILGYKVIDGTKVVVPDTTLPERNQVGISFRPRQSMFKYQYDARENLIDVINDIFESRDISKATDVSSWLIDVIDKPTDYDDVATSYSELMAFTDEDVIGKKVLVKRDETHNNIWTIYYVRALGDLELVDYQEYDISKYLEYKPWYKDNEIKAMTPVTTCTSIDGIDTSNYEIGDVIKVVDDEKWYLYQWDGKNIKNLVGVSDALLGIKPYIYEYETDTTLSKTDEFIVIGDSISLSSYDYINNEVLVIYNSLFEYFES